MTVLSFLQQQGFSRRRILQEITQGTVFLNNSIVTQLKAPLNEGDILLYQGQTYLITLEQDKKETSMILFHKPQGFVVSKSDPHNHTIYELLPKDFQHRYYIGRLDKDSRGLVLLTNSAELVYHYEHPSFGIIKEYEVVVSKALSPQQCKQTLQGVNDKGDVLVFLKIETIQAKKYRIFLSEGKKRHIRRVFKALGSEVIDLKRVKEGERELGNIPEGKRKKVDISTSFSD